MRNARNQFILLGFLCQGLSWDNYIHLLCSTALWAVCLRRAGPTPRLSATAESLVLALGCLLSYALAGLFGKSAHFALGDGLIAIQAVRLMRPLNSREKMISILIACFHVGVVCTLAPDVRFVALIAGAVYLLPKTLLGFHMEQFAGEAVTPPAAPLGFRAYAGLAAGALALFLVLPRFTIGTPMLRGAGAEDGLLGSIMDPTRSAGANSDRVVLQIDGPNLGYLRCHVLTEFDGVVWRPIETVPLRKIAYAGQEELPRFRRRQARVRNVSMLGRILPADGRVVGLFGSFFNRALENAYGVIECGAMWNSADNTYTYWVDPNPAPEKIHPALLARYLDHPRPSTALAGWLDKITGPETNRLELARGMERYLRTHFTYKLGAPELSRLTPVDDFVFNQKQGHCERFASTLALLLRMRDIPSRVVVGYLPSRRNGATGWYQIRFKDAHAWTEAYIEGQGWITLDATPPVSRGEGDTYFQDLWDSLESAWYSRVVNFDGFAQRQFFASAAAGLQNLSAWFASRGTAAFALALCALLAAVWKSGLGSRPQALRSLARFRRGGSATKTYYDRMLRLLEKRGLRRADAQTPLEFLGGLRDSALFGDIELITRRFCENHYGGRALSNEETRAIEAALGRIKKAPRRQPAANQ